MSGKSVNWTREQRQVIESRGKELLVSAAAGSGKTAVLVERIIRMVTEGENPLDIDKLLVMTFTNAAAAEMRERIGAAIEEKLRENPENAHLQIQEALVHHAQITTIDSFCLNIIREHFNLLDLDPAFKIGDEGELLLLRNDAMREMLEDYYDNGGRRFERFVETYAKGKSDAGIEDYIMQVYTFSQSNPYPEQWIALCRRELSEGGGLGGAADAAEYPWIQFLVMDLKKQAEELKLQLTDALNLCREDEFLCAYAPMLEQDVRQLDRVLDASGFVALYESLLGIAWDRLATVRSKEVDPDKKAYVTGCRDRVKKAVGKMRELYCYEPPKEMMEDMEGTVESIGMLLDLAEEFAARFQEKKRDRNLVDFNDLEHEALKVLIRLEDGKTVYTEAADELSMQYEEVLVDEYQDSNLVQEALLQAVSQARFGRRNVFMVGDVKQSIYKFRLARPELFLEKYDAFEPYEQGDGDCKKIELHQNFRSREQVLSGINDVFFRIMTENLGNIRYTEETALHPGAGFAEPDEELVSTGSHLAGVPQLLVVDTGNEAFARMEEDAADYTAKELEARLIAGKIREMTDPQRGMLVWDKRLNGTGGYRTAQYRDMVILLRSTAGWTENLLSVLMNEGIPAYAESRMGYFNTLEVETVLAMLSVIDNPMQDIPLAAVLKSPIGGMRDEELAKMMAEYRACADKGQDRGIYAALSHAISAVVTAESPDTEVPENLKSGLAPETLEKLKAFGALLEKFSRRSTYTPIHQLIYHLYEETGYYNYVAAMPAGETRKANLDMLVEKAAAYEQTSYKGLFHFVRYIESLKRYNTDFGEASTVGEEDNTVRIMSIHKSKGLEFPIVFLAGMGKKFNRQDIYGKILIDSELGIGTDYLDLEHRLKTTTLKKNVLKRKMELDNLGEELRVLYVAMTRAKEQLIMTGTDKYLTKTLEKYAQVPMTDGQIPYTILSTASSYLDWILMCLSSGQVRIRMTEEPLAEIVGGELVRQVQSKQSRDLLLGMDKNAEYDRDYRQMLKRYLEFQYPYQADIGLHTTVSVSELKKQGQMTDEAESVHMVGEVTPDWEAWLTERWERRGGQEQEQVQVESRGEMPPYSALAPDGGVGATRGTAYHRAMELLPFERIESQKDVESWLAQLVEEKRFTRENLELVDSGTIWAFLDSDFGRRMKKAQAEGRLHKEQQFVMGLPAREMGMGDSDELVVIQGIIDAYFEEEDGLVLMDYKTDKIRRAQTLVEHYKKQLDYYERALSQMTGKPVREKVIYSLTLQQAISC